MQFRLLLLSSTFIFYRVAMYLESRRDCYIVPILMRYKSAKTSVKYPLPKLALVTSCNTSFDGIKIVGKEVRMFLVSC